MSETQPLPESGQDRPCRSSFGACNEGRASRPVNGSLVLTRAPAGRSVLPLRGAAASAPAGVADARSASSQRGRARSRGWLATGREHVPSRVRSLGVHSSRRSDGTEGVVQAAASVGGRRGEHRERPREGPGETALAGDPCHRRSVPLMGGSHTAMAPAGPRCRSRGEARSGSGRPRCCRET